MNFKTCEKIHENFVLDEKFDVFLAVRKSGKETARVAVTDGLSRGYIYACLFFYDDVQKEIGKLREVVKKLIREAGVDTNTTDPAKKFLAISVRARQTIGDDSLDALIKHVLSEDAELSLALMPLEEESKKFDALCENIFLELYETFAKVIIDNAKKVDNTLNFKLSASYVEGLSERQKKLIAPAIRMVGFGSMVKMTDFKIGSDWSASYVPERLPDDFKKKEESIKIALKDLMQKHLV